MLQVCLGLISRGEGFSQNSLVISKNNVREKHIVLSMFKNIYMVTFFWSRSNNSMLWNRHLKSGKEEGTGQPLH